ncbi:hypothetical protein OAS39_06870 [Pirellulales bacterium]|nr:hypothetical protein [Pirellulales bacterium]
MIANQGPARSLLVGIALATTAGCGGKYNASVSGTVTLDGKPLESGTVAFHPKSPGPIGFGTIQSDGSYEVMCGQTAGLNTGEYSVTIVAIEPPPANWDPNVPPPPGRQLTADKHADPATTDLHFTVGSGSNDIDLQLTSDG